MLQPQSLIRVPSRQIPVACTYRVRAHRVSGSSTGQIAAVAGYNIGVILGVLGRLEEAVAAYDLVLDRYGGDPAPALRKQAARALVNKGVRLGLLGRSEEEIAAYDLALDRYGDDPALREVTERA